MYITCEACNTRYVVKASAITDEGRKVQCAKCQYTWFQSPPSDDELETIKQAEPERESFEQRLANATPDPSVAEAIKKWDRIASTKNKLPAVANHHKKAPLPLKIAASIALFIACTVGFILYRGPVTSTLPFLHSFYESVGIHTVDGMKIYNVQAMKMPMETGQTKLVIKGIVVNESGESRTIKKARIVVKDEDHYILQQTTIPVAKEYFAPNDELPFHIPLAMARLPEDSAYITIDIGSNIDLMRR